MKFSRKFLTLIFAMFVVVGSMAVTASAQEGRGVRRIQRPVIVRRYYVRPNPFGYRSYWRNPYYYGSYYDPYFYDPYLNAQRQKYYLQQELRGNKEELRKHLEKYNADGVITAKERKELDDDYKDVAKAERKLKEFEGDE